MEKLFEVEVNEFVSAGVLKYTWSSQVLCIIVQLFENYAKHSELGGR